MPIVTTIGADPARIDIDAHPGAPVDFTVAVLDGGGAAVTPSGWTLAAQIRASRDTAVLQVLDLTAVTGGVQVEATGEDTAGWADWGVPVARWDLWATPPAGTASPIAAGWVRIHPTTTH